jgi:hypothetical protein
LAFGLSKFGPTGSGEFSSLSAHLGVQPGDSGVNLGQAMGLDNALMLRLNQQLAGFQKDKPRAMTIARKFTACLGWISGIVSFNRAMAASMVLRSA